MRGCSAIVCVIVAFGLSNVASAKGRRGKTTKKAKIENRSWAEGVSPSDQKKALSIFKEANALYLDGQYPAALEKYQSALAIWDHPAIRFNMAETLVFLDKPVRAHENVNKSLAHGAEALGSDVHQRALTLQKVLEGQVSTVTIACDVEGAEVAVDGETLFTSPGSKTLTLRPGRHQVVATKDGLLPDTRQVALMPGEASTVDLSPKPIPIKETRFERRWDPWKPWAVVGAGAAVGAAGLFFQLQSRNHSNEFNDLLTTTCSDGCTLDELDRRLEVAGGGTSDGSSKYNQYRREQVVALSLYGLGAATLVTGAVLVIMNQPREVKEGQSGPRVSPIVGRSSAGLLLNMPF